MLQDNQPVEQNQPEQPVQAEQQPQAPAQPEPPKQPEKPAKPAALPVKTTQEEKMWAAIGYVAFLGVVTLAMQPKSEFCRRHASQGLVIFAVWFVALILMAGPSVVGIIGLLLLLAATVVGLLGIVKSLQSFQFNLPVLSDIAKKVPVDSIIGSMTGKTTEAPTPQEPAQPAQPTEGKQEPQQPAEPTATPPSQDEEPPQQTPQN